MLHSFLPAISVILLAATCVNADDYLLRIETIGLRTKTRSVLSLVKYDPEGN